jgi:hypothetical protein
VIRRITFLFLLTALAFGVLAAAGAADLTSRYQAGQQRSGQLRSAIRGENSRIEGFEGTIGSLEGRLTAVEGSVTIQERLLTAVDDQLYAARRRLAQLRAEWPPPTLMGVVVDAGGFNQLLNGLSQLTAIERQNTIAAEAVRAARAAVTAETARLAANQARRQRSTTAVLVERDTIAQLKLSIIDRELAVVRTRDRNRQQLDAMQRTLVHEAAILDARAAAAQTLTSGGAVAPPGGCANTTFVPHGGEYGFFPAPGTNYQVNQEPIIAARLDQLGKALDLHLIGISGYRTPQHSVEVGGYADDPHTRGEASDTPGVEGVPESTLLEFCLTRPFPGPREADHIQES